MNVNILIYFDKSLQNSQLLLLIPTNKTMYKYFFKSRMILF